MRILYAILLALCCFTFVYPQGAIQKSISGAYRVPSNSPEGGTTVLVAPDGRFAVEFFGGMIKGTYEIMGNTVFFTTTAHPGIALYGRNLASLKDSSQVNFRLESGVYAKLDPSKKDMRPVFNLDANCFSFPYVYDTDMSLETLQFAVNEPGKTYGYQVFTFINTEGYNDFMVVKLKDHHLTSHTLHAQIKDGLLYFDGGTEPTKRMPLSIEEASFVERFLSTDLLPETLDVQNQLFPKSNRANHHDPEKTYHRLIAKVASDQQVVIGKSPFFTAQCE